MRIPFLNINIDNLTMQEALEEIDHLIQLHEKSYVVTPNLDHIVLVESDKEFRKIYQNATLVLTDGKPMLWISKFLGRSIKEKVSGSDIFPMICDMASRKDYSIFILGAEESVAQEAARRLKKRYKGLRICGLYSPPIGFEKDDQEMERIIELINLSKVDILAVALGAPKGEKVIYHIKDRITASVSIQIGATIDFIAGKVNRAPKWMSEIGLEWLYRIFQDPKRLLKRYLRDAIGIIPIIFRYAKRMRV